MSSTATLYHEQAAPPARGRRTALPPSLRHVLIVGGGTAGWMTALTLGRSLLDQGVRITLVESPSIGTIGVGEGSTPWLRGFFDSLGIDESQWMPACHATYKCGISFAGWSSKPGFERYFHPFASMLDNLTMTQFVHNCDARVNGADVHAHPDRFFLAALLAQRGLAPKPAAHFPFDIWHGYHFDAVLLGAFLQREALRRGVHHRAGHVTHANLDAHGNLSSVGIEGAEPLAADLFVDCSGFAALLIERALKTPFVSFAENLFNDAAVALPSPIGERIPSETLSTALGHGWAWRIPLSERFGNGYVYSSQFCTADQAEQELRAHLGLLDADVPARHLRMRIGRATRHWHRNCVAIGLSGGFIEPLEATALLSIQQTAALFVECLERGDLSDTAQESFNTQVNEHYEGIRDYIVAHYKTSSRICYGVLARQPRQPQRVRTAQAAPQPVDERQGHRARRAPAAAGPRLPRVPVVSAARRDVPEAGQLPAPQGREAAYRMGEIDDLLARSAANSREHRAVLEAVPPRRRGESLQVYFW